MFSWRAGRPTRSTARELCSLDLAPATGWSTGKMLLLSVFRSRSTGGTTVENSTVGGRPAGRSTVASATDLDPTASFWMPIYWGSLRLFSTRFEESFCASFSYLFQWFPPHILEKIFSNQKESLSRGFQKWFFEFFITNSILVFLTHTWAFHCYINSIGELLWE